MSKKNFKGGLDSLLQGPPKEEDEEIAVPKRVISKTSQLGTKEGETRATFIVNEELLENAKALAWYNRVKIKDVINDALREHLENDPVLVKKALGLYRKSNDE